MEKSCSSGVHPQRDLSGFKIFLMLSWNKLLWAWPRGVTKKPSEHSRKDVLDAGKEAEAQLRDIVVPGYQDSVVKGE